MKEIRITIPKELEGTRLDAALSKLYSAHTRSQLRQMIDDGFVLEKGVPSKKASLKVKAGMEFVIKIPEPQKLNLTPQEVSGVRILFEDENLAVLEKPAGVSVHPSHTEKGPTLVHALLHSLKSLSSIGGVERPGIVHRIDKGTSGILVVSKTDSAHVKLSKLFKEHTIDRRYLALVYGDVREKLKRKSGKTETFFGRSKLNRKKMTGKISSGRKAITNWEIKESFTLGLTLLECKLETGRTHQIRVHLSELGFSVVGDPLYGEHSRKAKMIAKRDSSVGELLEELNHQLLHAHYLGFEHPVTGKEMKFESPLPQDFDQILLKCRNQKRG